jgi:hypothetical protein
MIDKLQPRKLDKDSDYKLVQKTSMIDALNVHISEATSGDQGNSGVIKPIRGTQALSFTDGTVMTSTDIRVLGSTVDDLTGVLYFYVWADVPEEQGVYAYDKRSILSEDGGLIKVYTSATFNFPPDGFVKGDIVYKREKNRPQDSTIPDVDSILYFTDNVNEPRKLDVYRALFAGDIPNSGNFLPYKIHDIICACPKVPMGNIDYEFQADATKQVSNFEKTPGIQFAVQGVYTDGSVTSIGPYSKIAFPPSIVNRGAAPAAKVLNHNVCKIKIPTYEEDFEYIKILFRYGNKASFRELAEVPNQGSSTDENWNSTTREYSFYNDQVVKGVSPSDVAKTFDNLPRQARAQSVVSNRLVFSNFKEGFDPYKPEVTTTVLFKRRPPEGVDFTVDIVPTIEGNWSPNGDVINKVMGFEIDTEQIPDDISEGTTISVAFSFSPDKNFHVFEARGGYQQSQHIGPVSGNFRGLPTAYQYDEGRGRYFIGGNGESAEIEDITAFSKAAAPLGIDNYVEGIIPSTGSAGYLLNDGNGSEGWTSALRSGQGSSRWLDYNNGGHQYGLKYDENHPEIPQPSVNAFFGRNFGVGYRCDEGVGSSNYPFKNTDGTEEEQCPTYEYKYSTLEPFTTRSAYGTSAGNPLIFQGGALLFNVSFQITQDVSNGRAIVAQTIEDAMVRRSITHQDSVNLLSVQNEYTHKIDIQLKNGDKIYPGEVNSDLICASADVGNTENPSNMMNADNLIQLVEMGGRDRRIPMHYFIVNKADVRFFFEPAYRPALPSPRKAFQLSIASVNLDSEDGLFTCIKRPEPTTPWYCISKSKIDDVLENQTSYSSIMSSYTNSISDDSMFLDMDGIDLFVEMLEYQVAHKINLKALGRIKCKETDPDSGFTSFFPCSIDIDDELYSPSTQPSETQFRFSILDGAGGPGGYAPGSSSAYASHDNGRFGSVAGQMIATFHGVHDSGGGGIRSKLKTMVPSIGSSYSEDTNLEGFEDGMNVGVRDIGVIGGVYVQDDEGIGAADVYLPEQGGDYNDHFFGYPSEGAIRTRITPDVNNSGVPSQKDVVDWCGGEGNSNTDITPTDDRTLVTYLLCGPFFTGSIALNPIATNPQTDAGEENISGVVNHDGDDAIGPLSGVYNENSPTNGYEFLNGATSKINKDQQWNPAGVWDQTTTMPYIFSGSTNRRVYQNQFAYSTVFPFPLLDGANLAPPPSSETGFTVYDQPNSPLYEDLYDQGSLPTDLGWNASHPTFGSISWEDKPGHAEMASSTTSVTGPSGKPIMTFKANANHEFGIIYYDERGRHGRVNHLTSVYVPGFSPAERNGIADGGPAHIRMKFNSDPPEWARYYKIAYSKNTSISDFFQYSSGGAFIPYGESPIDSGLNSAKFYVSLNYLQGHPISYSDSWGAKSQLGSPVVFQPEQGDKVRVISYQRGSESQTEKVFPRNIVFDVIGIESLDESSSNPLWNVDADGDVPENRKGLFLTVRNNPANEGFSYADIEQSADGWGQNCIIEIYRPIDTLSEDDRLYYEIGPTYRCGNPLVNTGTLGSAIPDITKFKHLNHNHEDDSIEITDGDVFFRNTAVNLREFDGDEFIDLIRSEQVDVDGDGTLDDEWIVTSEPNFKSIYTEAMSASDLFKSDAISIGRPNKIDNDEKEVRRIASLVHSDKDIAKSSKVGYSSFNGSESNDKDLDIVHGQVDYTANTNDSLLVIQRNRVSQIPVDRNLISTADNEPSLISSSNFLNTPRYYAGKAGSDGNPESVAMENGNAYFVHKSDGKVFRFSPSNGIIPISDKGMKAYFRDLLGSVGKNDKIIGGYDPVKGEYLITIKNISELTDQNGYVIPLFGIPDLTFNTDFLPNSTTIQAETTSVSSGDSLFESEEADTDPASV